MMTKYEEFYVQQCLYLLTTRKKWGSSEDFFQVDRFLRERTDEDWWIGSLKNISKGMLGIVKVAKDPNSEAYYEKNGSKKLYAGIYWTFEVTTITGDGWIKIRVLDNFYKKGKIIDKETLIEIPGIDFFKAQGPRYLPCEDYERIRSKGLEINSFVEPTEISPEDDSLLVEGAVKKVYANAYERDPEARRRCIDQYGFQCSICGFDFEKVYGEVGKGYIQVHHLKPIAKIGKEYIVDPVKDMRPVCPNCHAMLHKIKAPKYGARGLDTIRSMIQATRQ